MGNGHRFLLEARSLRFGYNHVPVLKDVSLRAAEGEILAITGSNGSGKSTLLKLLMGLLKPDEGNIVVFDDDLSRTTPAKLARHIGYLGQNPNDYLFEETMEKELVFTLSNLGIPKDEWEERMAWSLETVGLSDRRHFFPRDLSCGERERAALASIIVGRPRILILDEPTRGLDAWNKGKLGTILESLRDKGMTTILVTHDHRFIAEYATRVMRLKDGVLFDIPMLDFFDAVRYEGDYSEVRP